MIHILFAIAYIVNRNDHTYPPVFWCFSKFACHLTHLCQPTHSFSIQCLQHFSSDFVFTNNIFGIQYSYSCCHFCECAGFVFPILYRVTCIRYCCPTRFNKSSKYSFYRERIFFSFPRMFPVESSMEVVVLELFPGKRQMVCQNTFLANK